MNDGKIVFSTELDNKGMEKDLANLKKKIQRQEDQLSDYRNRRAPLAEQASKMEAALDAAKAKLYEMQAASAGVFSKEQLLDQKENVSVLQNQWNKVQDQVESYDRKIQQTTAELARNKEQAGEIAEQLAKTGPAARKMANAMAKAEKNARRFSLRMKEVLRSALLFTLISQTMAKLREWVGKVIRTNDEATAAIARLKGALLTLAQPIIDVIIPAFTTFVNIFSFLVSKIAGLVSMLFGKTAEQSAEAAASLQEEVDALDATGTAAKKAGRSLASFDEINKLSDNSGSGSSSEEISPDFSVGKNTGWIKEVLGDAAGYVTAALLLGGVALVAIGACTGRLSLVLAGLLMLGAGVAIGQETGVLESWIDKLGLDSVFDYVAAAMQLAGIALVAIGACMGNIAMVIAGGVLMGFGIAAEAIGEETLSDWWETLKLMTVHQWVGVAMALSGIALIAIGACMGNVVMILGGMALIGLGTITNASEGNLKDWVTVLGLEKVAGWVTGALLLGGIALLVIGIVTANIPMVLAGLGLLGAGVSVGITSGTFTSWLDTISGAFASFKDKVLSIFNQLFGGVKTSINGIIGGVEWMANKVIDGINAVIRAINKVSFDMPDWLGGDSFGFNIGLLKNVSIPRLATGAVIPPNREFLAVLGDQKSGNNIEAPEELIRQIVREEGGGSSQMVFLMMELLEAVRAGHQIVVDKEGQRVIGQVAQKYINNQARTTGAVTLK